MAQHTLRNGQSATVAAHQWDGDTLAFAGTSGAATPPPAVTFTGPDTLSGVTDTGTASTTGAATISLSPGAALVTNGLTVNDAMLSISQRPGTSVTFDGISQISNGSTLTATGYAGAGAETVNGTMSIDGTSTANLDYVSIAGTGTFHLTAPGALLRVGTVGAGETVKLDGGMLSLTNGMSFLGTITDSAPATSRIGSTASVAVYNALNAVQETFDQTTGMLSLFTAQGTEVANLKFAGTGALYAAPTTGLATNYMAITSHPSTGALHVTMTH
ncbi:hypothetical protein [Rhodopila sp.]|uniref:hypothetical protein n=1 Tax=Rhodopila sp. TaxID=2480087 RepID=UPI003D13DD6D